MNMIQTRISSLDFGVVILVAGLSALPQTGFAQSQTDTLTQAADHGRWVWSRDHWVWSDKDVVDTRGTDIKEAGVADVRSSPLHEAGVTLRRTIAVAMSAP
jgi:hypothetical protein